MNCLQEDRLQKRKRVIVTVSSKVKNTAVQENDFSVSSQQVEIDSFSQRLQNITKAYL